jgi:predicted kinase
MATLHFFCGKAGAGKTTLARELGRSLPAIVICEDEWIAALGFEVRSLADYRDASGRFRNLIGAVVPDLLSLGVSVILDCAAKTAERRAWVRSLFEAACADHALHGSTALTPSASTTSTAAMTRSRRGSTGSTSRTSSSSPSTRTSSLRRPTRAST